MLTVAIVYLDRGEISHAYRIDSDYEEKNIIVTPVTDEATEVPNGMPVIMIGREPSGTVVMVEAFTEEVLNEPIFQLTNH